MLSEKTALVTGSSSGIGKAIAVEFAEQGADVAVNYSSNEEGAREAATAVREAGQRPVVVGADVSDPDEAQALVETTREELGEIDVLVNNAGIYPRTSWEDVDWETVLRTLSVNVGGLVNVSRCVAPAMLDRGEGSIINMSSIWAVRGGVGNVAYTASKGAITALTRQMCAEFAPQGVRANVISPGAVETAINAEQREGEEYMERVTGAIPAGRWGQPADIAHMAAFLASDRADYVNGADLVVDGGVNAT
jgi:NAD(P)-dependent dehydrogenase (short-subunit alcohol dehydrogenase family)